MAVRCCGYIGRGRIDRADITDVTADGAGTGYVVIGVRTCEGVSTKRTGSSMFGWGFCVCIRMVLRHGIVALGAGLYVVIGLVGVCKTVSCCFSYVAIRASSLVV